MPTVVAPEYGHATSLAGRFAAMSRASARPGRLRRHLSGAAAVHYPLTLRIPPVGVPSVVTLHDVQHLELPQLFSRAERAFRAVAWHGALRRADRVIAISEFVRGRAIATLGLDPERISVVPLGLDHDLLRPGGEREPFLYYPARRWPHKNHARLFEAFAVLRRERPGLRLVLSGGGSFVEHGAAELRLRGWRHTAVRFLALAGALHLFFFLAFSLPSMWGATHSDRWVAGVPSYFTAMCPEYPAQPQACGGAGIPAWRPDYVWLPRP